MRLADRTVTDLLEAFSSPDPTPGGGSAAALAGALGASLLAMVAAMSKTKNGTPEERAALDRARPDLLTRRAHLLDLADRDSAAYDLVVSAYKRPKATDEEKAARKAAIQEAMRVATDVPLETMQACAGLVPLAKIVATCGNKSAMSDIKVGLHLTMAGMQGARNNVEVNLGSLTDAAVVAAIKEEIQTIMRANGIAFHEAFSAAE